IIEIDARGHGPRLVLDDPQERGSDTLTQKPSGSVRRSRCPSGVKAPKPTICPVTLGDENDGFAPESPGRTGKAYRRRIHPRARAPRGASSLHGDRRADPSRAGGEGTRLGDYLMKVRQKPRWAARKS